MSILFGLIFWPNPNARNKLAFCVFFKTCSSFWVSYETKYSIFPCYVIHCRSERQEVFVFLPDWEWLVLTTPVSPIPPKTCCNGKHGRVNVSSSLKLLKRRYTIGYFKRLVYFNPINYPRWCQMSVFDFVPLCLHLN